MMRSREYRRLAKKHFIDSKRAKAFFFISEKTARRWYRHGAPLHVVEYLKVVCERNLAGIHPDWKGWRIGFNGKLYGHGMQIRPEMLKHWHEWIMRLNELEIKEKVCIHPCPLKFWFRKSKSVF